jgi:glycosyltransferase involved in cell wall biosynthesis
MVELDNTRRYEARLMREFDDVIVTSSDDARMLRALGAGARLTVIPNGVDLQHFQPVDGPSEPATLVFSGKMSYHANASAVLHFVREILPLIRQRRPDVRLRIVGSKPPPAVLALARDPAITVTGHVPDMREALGRGTIAICPVTVKVGIQNKVLEGMALGLPVVCSELGAEGIEAERDRDFLVAKHAMDFADHVCRLLEDPVLRTRIGQSGRRYVETHHRWASAAGRLAALYSQRIEGDRGVQQVLNQEPTASRPGSMPHR